MQKIPGFLRPVFLRYMKEHGFPDAEELLAKADPIYDSFYRDTIKPEDRKVPKQLYIIMAVMALFEASNHRLGPESILPMAEMMYERKAKKLSKVMDLNRYMDPKYQKPGYWLINCYAKHVNAKRRDGHHDKGWDILVNPDGHTEGFQIALSGGCPLVDFAKTHGYMDLMPYFCEVDYQTYQMLFHAKLTRNHTIAEGADSCDYWMIGDKSCVTDEHEKMAEKKE